MSEIKNIIFDLGGIIYDIDYHKTIHYFEKLGIKDAQKLYSQAQQSHLFDHYEKGHISTKEFIAHLQSLISFEVSKDAIIEAWNALLIGVPAHRLNFLKEVKLKHKIFLLSNTNALHIEQVHKELEPYNYKNFEPFFEEVYYSYQMGMRKPEAEIFQKVLDDHQLMAKETLFIDDSIQHIEAANKLGIQTYHHTKGDIAEVFDSIL